MKLNTNKQNNSSNTALHPPPAETLKPKRTRKLNDFELQELIIKETKINIEGKFNQYINFLLYWLSKSDFLCKDTEIKKILDLLYKMNEVLERINNNRNIS